MKNLHYKVLLPVVIGLVIILGGDIDSHKQKRFQQKEIPLKIKLEEKTDKEEKEINYFKKSSLFAACALADFRKTPIRSVEDSVNEFLEKYPQLNSENQKELKPHLEDSLYFLKNLYEKKSRHSDKFCFYEEKAIGLGLDMARILGG